MGSTSPSTPWSQVGKNFKINLKSSNDPDNCLPMAHTCYFSIDLPQHSTVEIMSKMLLMSMNFSGSIDGDGGGISSIGQLDGGQSDDDDDQSSLF
eukprot:TRINITY_DN5902_c0_g1_i1.p1 TRINITY_DN5902_c0_g1~~TRINITY_DN5902_c0_g1_i1.p1  ORF type:complete len:95 (+),score=7.01 TRINITY_DN5902_c0_g1_i1:56-340(+)